MPVAVQPNNIEIGFFEEVGYFAAKCLVERYVSRQHF